MSEENVASEGVSLGGEGKALEKLGFWLATGIAVLTGALASFGIVTGDIERIIRNTPDAALIWIAFIGFGVIAGVIVNRSGAASRKLEGTSLFMAAIGTLSIALVAGWSLTLGPSVDVENRLATEPIREAFLRSVFWTFAFVGLVWALTSLASRLDEQHLERLFHPWVGFSALVVIALVVPPLLVAWPWVFAIVMTGLGLGALVWLLGKIKEKSSGSSNYLVLAVGRTAGHLSRFSRWLSLAVRYRIEPQEDAWTHAKSAIMFINVVLVGLIAGMLLSEANPPSNITFLISSVVAYGMAWAGWRRLRRRMLLVDRFGTPDGPLILLLTLVWAFVGALLVESWAGAVLAVALWLVVYGILLTQVKTSSGQGERKLSLSLSAGLLVIGFLAFLAGVAGFFVLGVANAGAQDRPKVTASLVRDGGTLSATASIAASGLRSDEHVVITVEGLNSQRELSDVAAGPGSRIRDVDLTTKEESEDLDFSQVLHLSRVGADETGNVSAEISVPISTGVYERIRVSAFIAKIDGPDLISRLETARTQIRDELARQNEVLDEFRKVYQTADFDLATVLLSSVDEESPDGKKLLDSARTQQAVAETPSSRDLFTLLVGAIFPPDNNAVNSGSEVSQITAEESGVENAAQIVEAARNVAYLQRVRAYEAFVLALQETYLLGILADQKSLACDITLLIQEDEIRKAFEPDEGCTPSEPEETQDACDGKPLLSLVEARLSELEEPEGTVAQDNQADAETEAEFCMAVVLAELADWVDGVRSITASQEPPAAPLRSLAVTETLIDAIHNEIHANSYPLGFTDEAAFEVVVNEIRLREEFLSLLSEMSKREDALIRQRRAAAQCNEEGQVYGCVILLLPEVQSRPIITVSPRDGSPSAIDVTITATEVGALDYVILEVTDSTAGDKLLVVVVGPDRAGTIQKTFRVLLPENGDTCIRARLIRGELPTPASPGTTTILKACEPETPAPDEAAVLIGDQ